LFTSFNNSLLVFSSTVLNALNNLLAPNKTGLDDFKSSVEVFGMDVSFKFAGVSEVITVGDGGNDAEVTVAVVMDGEGDVTDATAGLLVSTPFFLEFHHRPPLPLAIFGSLVSVLVV